jgi:hypothetical protein
MQKKVFITIVLLFGCAAISIAQEGADAANTKLKPSASGWYWGFGGSIEAGGIYVLESAGLDAVARAGYGTLGRDSITAIFSLEGVLSRPGIVDIGLGLSYLGGGSIVWSDCFGHLGDSFCFYPDSLAVQAEVRPTFAFLGGVQPFVGGGYSLTNGLVDDVGDGFVNGWGPFVMGGLDLFSSFGMKNPVFAYQDGFFFGLRASVTYRFPYAYGFKVDGGLSDPAMSDFFGGTFSATNLSFGIGLAIGAAPTPL